MGPEPSKSHGEDGVDPFAQAYYDYLRAVKAAWAEVDIDAVTAQRDDDEAAFSTLGSAGSFGTFGSAPATVGSLGSFGCFGSLGAVEPQFMHGAGTAGTTGTYGAPPARRASPGPGARGGPDG